MLENMRGNGGHSQEIIIYKQKALSSIANNDNVLKAINAKNTKGKPLSMEELYYTHLFPYGFIPETIEEAGCYVCVEVSMPQVSTKNYFFKEVLLVVTIICHQGVLRMTKDEPLGSTGANRMDYIGVEIDKLFNGRTDMGYGELDLVSNIEGAVDIVHRYRTLRFAATENKKSFC